MTRSELQFEGYGYHGQYYSINTGVHRKGGVELVTPTLAHHVGLWYPPTPSAYAQLSVAKFGPQIDDCVGRLLKAMRGLADFESNFKFVIGEAEIVCLFGGAYEVMADGALRRFEPSDQPCHFALRDALESDNRILFMKGHWRGLDVIVRCEFRSEYATITRFVTLREADALHPSVADLPEALALLTRLGRREKCTEDDITASYVTLYSDHWESIDHELFGSTDLFRTGCGADASLVFADFRGVVLAGTDEADAGTTSLSSINTSPHRGRPFQESWPSKHLIPSIWPFLTVRNGLDLKRREFTASFMLEKRAVYITALGPQPPADDGLRCAPLHYLLVARPVSDWQLGALVDRLHFMGTVRLAALVEMKALREAGANLRDMEHESEAARRAIECKDLPAALGHYQRAMDLIAHKNGAGEPIFWAGLQYRVERSRYYVQRFDELIPFLGVEPVEGYQRYHHFVKARLGGVYDYISRLGGRQERAVKNGESIFQRIWLLEASETNRQIAEANRQSSLANERSAEANDQSAKANEQSAEANKQNSIISRTIEKLQTKAEIALLAVIVPHYLMEIVKELDERTGTVLLWDKSLLSVGILFALGSLIFYVLDKYKEKDFERLVDMGWKYLCLAIASAFIVLVIVHR